jgi:hypothetical protein
MLTMLIITFMFDLNLLKYYFGNEENWYSGFQDLIMIIIIIRFIWTLNQYTIFRNDVFFIRGKFITFKIKTSFWSSYNFNSNTVIGQVWILFKDFESSCDELHYLLIWQVYIPNISSWKLSIWYISLLTNSIYCKTFISSLPSLVTGIRKFSLTKYRIWNYHRTLLFLILLLTSN